MNLRRGVFLTYHKDSNEESDEHIHGDSDINVDKAENGDTNLNVSDDSNSGVNEGHHVGMDEVEMGLQVIICDGRVLASLGYEKT